VNEQRLPLLHQFVRFTGVGFLSAVGHYGLLIGLVQLFDVGAVPASTAGALLGAWINYRLNRQFTFRSRAHFSTAVPRFVLVAGGGVALNAIFMWIGVDLLRLHYLFSQLATTGLVLFWSFCLHKYWTFRHPPANE
jgi:putative flippase GtrA